MGDAYRQPATFVVGQGEPQPPTPPPPPNNSNSPRSRVLYTVTEESAVPGQQQADSSPEDIAAPYPTAKTLKINIDLLLVRAWTCCVCVIGV